MPAPRSRLSAAGLGAAGLISTLAAAQPAPPEDALDFYAAAPDLRGYVTAAVERNPAVLESPARATRRPGNGRPRSPRCPTRS